MTEYKIAWSKTQQAYDLLHTPVVFPLSDESIRSWLKQIDAFHLETRAEHSLTARKETKKLGSAYSYAYKRVDGKLKKKYLGDGNKITLTQLEALVSSLVEAPEPEATQQHHLDKGGLHLDIVAINHAYSFLKRYVSR